MLIDISKELPVHKYRTPKKRELTSINRIVVHTTNSDASIRALAKYAVSPFTTFNGEKIWNHVTKLGAPTFFYHGLITSTGGTFHCVDFENITFHAGNYNNRSVAIAINYVSKLGDNYFKPTEEAFNSLYSRVAEMCLDLGIEPKNVIGHREVPDSGWFWYKGSKRLRKECPGRMVSMVEIRHRVMRHIQQEMQKKGFYSASVDGIWGPRSEYAWVLYHCSK